MIDLLLFVAITTTAYEVARSEGSINDDAVSSSTSDNAARLIFVEVSKSEVLRGCHVASDSRLLAKKLLSRGVEYKKSKKLS